MQVWMLHRVRPHLERGSQRFVQRLDVDRPVLFSQMSGRAVYLWWCRCTAAHFQVSVIDKCRHAVTLIKCRKCWRAILMQLCHDTTSPLVTEGFWNKTLQIRWHKLGLKQQLVWPERTKGVQSHHCWVLSTWPLRQENHTALKSPSPS